MTTTRATFLRDTLSALLFVAAAVSIIRLLTFVAHHRLGVSVEWVGIITAASYFGYLWNLAFSRLTACLCLRQGVVVLMIAAAVLVWVTAFQCSAVPYCAAAIVFLLIYGLFEVQYNTMVPHLYDATERPRRLSARHLAIAIATAVLAPSFGWLCKGPTGHQPAFLIAGCMMIGGAVVFQGLRTVARVPVDPIGPVEVIRAALGNRAFKRVVIVFTLYGWVGAGGGTLFVVLYQACGLQEHQVGQLVAINIAGMLLGLAVVTPRLRFAGGLSNYRLCFIWSSVAMCVYGLTGFVDLGRWTFWTLGLAEFCFGLSAAGFALAMQTTGINLAPPGKETLYVNALMIVQGLRGVVAPILVAEVLRFGGLRLTLLSTIAVALLCALIVLVPGIDAMDPKTKEYDSA